MVLSLLAALALAAPLGASQIREKLRPCRVPGMQREALCGTYEVLENRKAKNGRRIPLNIVVLPTLASPPEPDPLVVLVGGPGQSATDGGGFESQRFARILEKRDIVLVDLRGTGKSNPLPCAFENTREFLQVFLGGADTLKFAERCRDELAAKADLRFYTTAIAMDDLDEVRAWLGYEYVNLYGGSYGTRAALVYLRKYPKHVRTVTIRAVTPLSQSAVLHVARSSQQSLDLLIQDCAADAACAKTFPNLKRDIDAVFERLAKQPPMVSVKMPSGETAEVEVTRDVFAGALRQVLSDANSQRAVPLRMTQYAATGDFSNIGAMLGQIAAGMGSTLTFGLNITVTCAEDSEQLTPEAIARETAGHFQGDAAARAIKEVCAIWPRSKLPRGFHKPVRSDKPVLLLSGRIDSKTPPGWAESVARTLPNSLHLVMPGISHGPFPQCAIRVMSDFVSAGTAKGLDTACIAEQKRPPWQLQ